MKNAQVSSENPDVVQMTMTTMGTPSLLERARKFTIYPHDVEALKGFRDVSYALLKRRDVLGGMLGEISFAAIQCDRLAAECREVPVDDPRFGDVLAAAQNAKRKLEAMIAELEAIDAEYKRLHALDLAVNQPAATVTTRAAGR